MNTTEHLLVCLSEECAEVAKDVTKSLRFGLDDVNVLEPDGPTNRQRLIDELNDLYAMVVMLTDEGILPCHWYDVDKINAKMAKVRKFMDYAAKAGALQP